MGVSRIRRGTAASQTGFPAANAIRVDSTAETLRFGTGASGSTEKEVCDLTSTQTLSGKTISRVDTIITGDGAAGITSGLTTLTKGSAAAITLAAPTVTGQERTITSDSAFAHVVTATSLIQDGVTGGAKSTMTFAAFPGATVTLVSTATLKWNVKSKNAVTIT